MAKGIWPGAELGQFVAQRTQSITPANEPTTTFELYSVPSFDTGRPEIVRGGAIGSAKQRLAPGDVLICKINPRINRVWVVGERGGHPQIGSTEWIRFPRHEDVLPEFLAYHLKRESVRSHLAMNASGVGGSLMRVKPATIASEMMPLPPLDSQRRIVARIDALFSELDDGEAALAQARADLETYRKSLLKAAVTGALTADWRDRYRSNETASDLIASLRAPSRSKSRRGRAGSRLVEIEPDVGADLAMLPSTWSWTTLGELGEVTGGVTKNAKRMELPLSLPYLRVANVGAGKIDLDHVESIGLAPGEVDRVRLLSGDLLIVEGNGSIDQIGRSAVWAGQIDSCVHQNHLIKVRFSDLRLAHWVQLWLQSPHGRVELEMRASSTSGLHTLSISKVSSVRCPLPPSTELTTLLEQTADLRTAGADADDETKELNMGAKNLRQSILSAAFGGELS